MNQDRTINIRTECCKCEFCILDNDVQTGCRIDRLQKYIDANMATKDKDTYVIGTWCNTFRSFGYIGAHNSEAEAITTLQKEIQIQSDFIILAIEEDTNLSDILYSVKASQSQTVQPSKLIIVIKGQNISYRDLQNALEEIIDIPYLIVRIIDPETDIATCIDFGARRCTSMYYTLWEAGYNIPIDYLAKLNCLINEDLKQFSMIQCGEDAINGLTIQSALHKILGGNTDAWIGEKIKKLAEEQQKEKMVIKYE